MLRGIPSISRDCMLLVHVVCVHQHMWVSIHRTIPGCLKESLELTHMVGMIVYEMVVFRTVLGSPMYLGTPKTT